MANELAICRLEAPRDISSVIWEREGKVRFKPADGLEYSWQCTYYMYGKGHYMGNLNYTGIRTQGSVPILFEDKNTWSAPVYRHKVRKREFFVPGLAFGVPDRNMSAYEYYPLNEEEKEEIRQKIYRDYTSRIEQEVTALHEAYQSYFDTKTEKIPGVGPIVFLFGIELYRGLEPEAYREQIKMQEQKPTVEIYPAGGFWKK